MKNSRLIEILKSFSREEIKQFDKFISSPYFGCRKFIIDFFRIIKKYHPEFDETKIKKEKLFYEMYKNRKYNDGLMRRMSSEIIKFALEFLMLKKFKEINAFKNNCLLMELRNRKLDNFFESKSRQIVNSLKKNKISDLYALLDRYLTETELYNYKILKVKTDMFDQLETSLESLILLFSYSLFSTMDKFYLIDYKFKKDITKEFNDKLIGDNLFRLTGKQDVKCMTLFRASYFAYNIIKDKFDEDSYLKLKKILSTEKEYFTKNQLRTFYSYIFYFYNFYNSRNSDKYFKDEYDAYNLILREDLFLNYSPYMSIFFCRNYIIACKRVKKPESIRRFIEKYSEYFLPENKENIINYAKALIMLDKKEFGKALEYSAKINLDIPQFKNDIKILRIKCYYELNYTDSLENEIDALNHFYRNLKKDNPKLLNIGFMIIVGRNYAKYLTFILKLKDKFNKNDRNLLVNKIENEIMLNEKKWLIERINELK